MGTLIDGKWQPSGVLQANKGGAFARAPSSWRGVVTADGRPGPDGRSFPAQVGRYHLIVSYACPWAHRALLVRALRGLSAAISCDVVEAVMGADGWAFAGHSEPGPPGATADRLHGKAYLRELYVLADPEYTGRVTVPVLWDKVQQTIVSNESADIMQMLDEAFALLGATGASTRPLALRAAIEQTNQELQLPINNGVYRCGFATSQAAYEQAFVSLFAALDGFDQRLAHTRFLHGEAPTESDWRFFTTLVRFDAVYVAHFRCNRQRIVDFKYLWPYLQALYRWPNVAQTVHFDHIKEHYFRSHRELNPTRIVPMGPALSLT